MNQPVWMDAAFTSVSCHDLGSLTEFQIGPVCLGAHVPTDSVFGDSEDCLFLDVYSPAFTSSSDVAPANLPVYIWIPGGGYTQLFNHNYNGSDVIAATGMDIVIVVINYRVGPFGFLGGEAVTKNGSANAGLLDQRLAFAWVQKYIQMVSEPIWTMRNVLSSGY